MDFGHFWFVKVLLESSFKSVALGKSIMGSFSGHLNYLFHENFLFSSSKPNSCPKQCFSRTNEPNHSTIPRSLVQKVSVQCILGTVNTGCLLSAFDRSRGIDTSKRASTMAKKLVKMIGCRYVCYHIWEGITHFLLGKTSRISASRFRLLNCVLG